MDTKTCSRCGETKPLGEFSRNASRRDGQACWCKTCSRGTSKARRDANPEQHRARFKAWYATNTDKARARRKAYCAANAEKIRAQKVASRAANPAKGRERNWRRQGIALSYREYARMLSEQNGRCANCAKESKLVVDHSHTTGRVRQLLCNKCNTGLGAFEDDALRMRNAVAYVHLHDDLLA